MWKARLVPAMIRALPGGDDRDIDLNDTFSGTTEPSELDTTPSGEPSAAEPERREGTRRSVDEYFLGQASPILP